MLPPIRWNNRTIIVSSSAFLYASRTDISGTGQSDSFSLEPKVCDVDAGVEPYPFVLLRIVDELIQQFAHPRSTADVYVAGVAEFHRMPQGLVITGIKGIL